MEIRVFRDNELITGISILAVLRYANNLELAKCMLIEPLLSYAKVLGLLKRTNSNIKSIEDLILKESIVFSNFSRRYYEKMILTVNSLLLFEQFGLLSIEVDKVVFKGEAFNFSERSLGKKAQQRIQASKKLAEILTKGDASDIYLSLRVEL